MVMPGRTGGARSRVGAGATTADIRRENLGRVLRTIHLDGPMSRAALTAELGLARGTVGILVDTLVDAGYLQEREPEATGRGRPSPVIDVVPQSAAVLATELAVDGVRLTVTGLGGRVVSRHEWAHEPDGVDAGVARLADELAAAGQRRRRAGAQYEAVGVAVWGIVRAPDGHVNVAPSIGWHDVALGDRLREALGAGAVRTRSVVQHVVVANDADLGAVAEYRRGAGRGSRRLLYLHSDVGVGAGLVWNGTLLSASGGYSGEVGHMVVAPDGIRCDCGAIGCWETEVDQRALLRAAGRDPSSGTALEGEVSRVLEDAAAGDPAAYAAAEKVATALGTGLANLVQILGPDRVVLGYYLSELYRVCPLPVRRALQQRGFSPEARDLPIVAAELGKDAPVLGATEIALEPLLADPVAYP